MIQRVQSLFFLGIILFMLILLFSSHWESSAPDGSLWQITSFEVIQHDGDMIKTQPAWYTAVLISITMILTTFTLFSYKNRMRQMVLSTFLSFFIMTIALSLVYFIHETTATVNGDGIASLHWWSVGLIILSFIFNMLAKIYIRKDHNLVKSVDRLR